MALVLKDRVRETSTTAGTGPFTLAGAVTGYQSFAAIGNGNTTYYTIYLQSSNEWEVGVGTYTAAGTVLSRDTILSSSNSGLTVNFSAGTKDVFVTYPAGRSVYYDTATNVPLTGALTALGLITPRVATLTDATSVTINSDTTDVAIQINTQAFGTLTVNGPTGTPVNGQKLIFRLRSTNIQTFSWDSSFQGSTDLALPTGSSGSNLDDYMGFIYNTTALKWQLVAKVFGF